MRLFLAVAFLTSSLCVAGLALRANSAAAEGGPDLRYRTFVPAMAADAAAPNASTVAATHLYQRVDGGLVVTGEVVNSGGQAITAAKVRVTLTLNGSATSRETESLVTVIGPGGTGPFQAFFPGVTNTAGSISATVASFEASGIEATQTTFAISGPYPFQIGPPDPKTNVIPYSTIVEQLRGKVTNTGTTPLAQMGVVVAAYDGAGNVVFVTTGSEPSVPFQQAGEAPVLEAGHTGSFVAGVPIGLLLTFEGEVTLNGFLNGTSAN